MKKVIFLIRGLGREQRHWGADFPKILQAKLPGFKLVYIDLPGFGDQYQKASPLSVEKIAKEILDRKVLKEYEGYKEKYILGLSLGGMVSIQLLWLRPDFFTGVIVMNSSQKHKTPISQRFSLSLAWKALYGSLVASTKQRESIIYDMTINSDVKLKSEFVKKGEGFYNSASYTKINFLRQLIAGSSFSLKGWRGSGKKGLVLTSYADKMVSWKASKGISELLSWPILINNNAGHDLSFDEPAWICNKVEEFINTK